MKNSASRLLAEMVKPSVQKKEENWFYPSSLSREGEVEFLAAYDPSQYGLTADSVVNTADNVIFTTGEDGKIKVLLIQRKNHPFKSFWCLPGGFIDKNEEPLTAAVRELKEETSVAVSAKDVIFVGKYDEAWRDPRMERIVSYAYTAFFPEFPHFAAADDAADAAFFDVAEILQWKGPELGFDHHGILIDAVVAWDKKG